MDIYLLRHPPVQNSSGVCYGQTDIALAQDWIKTAKSIQKALPKNLKIYSSDLGRCRNVASYLNDKKVTFDQRLRELNFGIWENKPWKDIPKEDIDAWNRNLETYIIQNGESYSQMKARVYEVWKEIISTDEDTLIITHAGVIRALLAHLLETSAHATLKLTIKPSSLTKLSYLNHWLEIRYINKVFCE